MFLLISPCCRYHKGSLIDACLNHLNVNNVGQIFHETLILGICNLGRKSFCVSFEKKTGRTSSPPHFWPASILHNSTVFWTSTTTWLRAAHIITLTIHPCFTPPCTLRDGSVVRRGFYIYPSHWPDSWNPSWSLCGSPLTIKQSRPQTLK